MKKIAAKAVRGSVEVALPRTAELRRVLLDVLTPAEAEKLADELRAAARVAARVARETTS